MIPLSYSLRSLMVRKATTAATAFGIALVVFVFATALMLVEGISRTLGSAGDPSIAIVLRQGSDAELASSIENAHVGVVLASRDVARRANGDPDGAAEVMGVIALDKIGDAGISNVAVRGVTEDSFAFRPNVHVVAGRRPNLGTDECMIGAAIRGRFAGMDLGQSFEIRHGRRVRVVGVFADRGSSYESEAWVGVDSVRTAFGREGLVSVIRVRLRDPSAYASFERSVEQNRQLGLDVQRETTYLANQSEESSKVLNGIGIAVAFFFSIAAMIGAMITMYASVARRGREIGTLRALGFKRSNVLLAFLIESFALGLLGGAVGAAASTAMGLVRFSIINMGNWSELVFRFTPTPVILAKAMVFAAIMGLLGGFFPALRAARLSVLEALRA